MNRRDLQKMAEGKFADAVLLFQNQRHASAYYLAGYAVELAIKAVIAKQIVAETIPDRQIINRVFTHKLDDLMGLGGLLVRLKEQFRKDPSFQANWGIVSNWSVESRYEIIDPFQAAEMLQAVGDPEHGILQWLKTHW